MASLTPPKDASGASGSSGLRRGEACTNCRHRKIRCDGVRPICGPCSQSTTGRWQECDFVPYSRTATRVLKEQIQSLEAHIEELQSGKSLSSSSPGRGRQSSSQAVPLVPVGAADTSSQSTQRFWLTAFFERAHDLHFFLDIPRFRSFFTSRSSAPLPVLLDAIYLWGSHLTLDAAAHAHEPSLLARVRQSITSAPANPETVLQTVQARLLYGQYCYAIDKAVEGGYHLTNAWSLAMASGLHSIEDVDPSRVDDRERVNAFWHTFVIACLWSCADGSPMPVSCTGGKAVLTPWPGAPPVPALERRGTIVDFLTGRDDAGVGSLALLAKASIILHRCTSFRANLSGGLTGESFSAKAQALEEMSARLGQRLPPLPEEAGPLRAALLTHTTLRVAVIQLHTPLSDMSPPSREQRAIAARAVARMASQAKVQRLGYLNPIMAALWATACHALIDELAALRGADGTQEEAIQWLDVLCAIEEAMSVFAPRCPVFESRLAIVRQVRVSVGI